jgi:hypothetical protein
MPARGATSPEVSGLADERAGIQLYSDIFRYIQLFTHEHRGGRGRENVLFAKRT